MLCVLYEKHVIQKPPPQSRWVLHCSKCLFLKVLHIHVNYNGTDWGTHGYPIHLFLIFTLEGKICTVEAETLGVL